MAGLDYLLTAWEEGSDTDLRWLAYALGTARHETAHTMQPIREHGGPAYFHRMYDPLSPDPGRAALAKREGARPGDGVLFYGRGYVQLTWRTNYLRAERELGLPLVADPDLALRPDVAARVMFAGMREGWFTNRRLGQYFTPSVSDWLNARRIINGLDRAADVAEYATQFHKALLA